MLNYVMTSSWTTKVSCRKSGSTKNKGSNRKCLDSEILWHKIMFLRRIPCCVFLWCSAQDQATKTRPRSIKKKLQILTGETEQTLGLVSPTDEENVIQWDLPKGYRRDISYSSPYPLFFPSHQLYFPCNAILELSYEIEEWGTSARAVSSLVR